MAGSSPPDFDSLLAFAAAARFLSLRKAAESLCLTEPPLSRKIKKLEEDLGARLFRRHARGLELTGAGEKALEIIAPLLKMREDALSALACLRENSGPLPAIGLTTALEQGAFRRIEEEMAASFGAWPKLARKSSPKLARDVAEGRLNAALVALPLDAPGLLVGLTDLREPLIAALPSGWPEAGEKPIRPERLASRPMFWFPRPRNPAWHDHMEAVFRHLGFHAPRLEEAEEHDVLLAAIASGRGFALMPGSFAKISREGVVFAQFPENSTLQISLGVIAREREWLERMMSLLSAKAEGFF